MPYASLRLALATALSACFLGAAWAPAQNAEPAAAGVYRERLEGDAAMSAKDYAVAAGFYAKYRETAAATKDKAAEMDAFKHLLDALISAEAPGAAAQALSAFEAAFPSGDPASTAFWRADILLLKGDAQGAKAVCETFLSSLPHSDPRRPQALFTLGLALESLGEFKEAAGAYSVISEASKEPSLAKKAFQRRVMCLAAAGDAAGAKDALLSFPPPAGEDDLMDLRLLGIFVTLKEAGPDSVAAAYLAAKKSLKEESPSPLAYAVASALGDAAVKAKGYGKAADFYRDAFAFSSGRTEACGSLRRIIASLEMDGKKDEAAALALRHLALFKDSRHAAAMKLQAARLLVSLGRRADALKLYMELSGDPSVDSADRLAAARECARTQIDLKDYDGAANTIKRFFTDGGEPGEGGFLLAEMLAKQGRQIEAAEAYMAVAATWKAWRDKALYEALRSYMEAGALDKAMGTADLIMREFETGEVRKDAVYMRARILEMKGDLDGAAKEYLGFAGSYPNHPDFASRAIYRAARIAFLKGRLQDASKLFGELAQKYPTNQLAPSALFWRVHALDALGDEAAMEKETWLLQERYPDSEFSKRALFRLAVHDSDLGAYSKAESVIDKLMAKAEGDPETLARALYEKAALAMKSQNMDKALQLLDELSERFPESPSASEGLRLHGDILKELGNYERAASHYQKAMERRPGSLLEAACLAGMGDCLFSLASEGKDPKRFEAALESYGKLLSKKDAPAAFKEMALFKAGRCLELLGDEAKAMENYKTLIYRFKVASGLGEPPGALWPVKAAEAIVDIAMRSPSPGNVKDAKAALEWLGASGFASADSVSARLEALDKVDFKP